MNNTKQQIRNAIRWINSLDPKVGYKKTVEQLGKLIGDDFLDNKLLSGGAQKIKNKKKDMAYCCLGVGCRVMDYTCIDYTDGYYERLEDDMGINPEAEFLHPVTRKKHALIYPGGRGEYITSMNDTGYRHDKDFKRVQKFFLRNLKYIFVPEVAEGLKKHFKK